MKEQYIFSRQLELRIEQHGASGLIATHARFLDAGSHGGGPEIPHEDECEKFGPSSAYWPPKRATRAYSRWLVYEGRLRTAVKLNTRQILLERALGAQGG